MDNRTRVLLLTAVGVAGAFLLYRVVVDPWLSKRKQLDRQIVRVESKLRDAKRIYARRNKVQKEWDAIRADLQKPEREGKSKSFDLYIRQMFDRTVPNVKRRPNVDFKSRPEQVGDFAETILEVKDAQLETKEWTRLLARLAVSKAFLRMRSLSLRSRTEKGDRYLVLNMGVSTIDYVPVRKKKPRGR